MKIDAEDRALLARIIIVSMLVLWCAVILGTAVRIVSFIGFGSW